MQVWKQNTVIMKLKLVINGSESPDDYKLLKSTISTVASLRKTAILRFTSDRLIIISTPNSSSNTSALTGDTGQLWCTIPRDVFSLYNVISARDLNTITMECNCDTLLSVLKKYERVTNSGGSSDMTLKLQSMPDWNIPRDPVSSSSTIVNGSSNGTTVSKPNPVCALGITFEEIMVMNNDLNNTGGGGVATSKVVAHSFKVPAKLLFKAQDARIQEPMINYTQLMMYKLPLPSSEFGQGFSNFIKRVDRYTNVHNVKLSAKKFVKTTHTERDDTPNLKIIVNELDWYLELCWNGPLDPVLQPDDSQRVPGQYDEENAEVIIPQSLRVTDEVGDKSLADSMVIEDSEINYANTSVSQSFERSLSKEDTDISFLPNSKGSVIEEDPPLTQHEVIIRCKDWKVCSKLYEAFEEIVLAISHDESCVFHCSLDRGSIEDEEEGERPKERGQIIYYMARSKGL